MCKIHVAVRIHRSTWGSFQLLPWYSTAVCFQILLCSFLPPTSGCSVQNRQPLYPCSVPGFSPHWIYSYGMWSLARLTEDSSPLASFSRPAEPQPGEMGPSESKGPRNPPWPHTVPILNLSFLYFLPEPTLVLGYNLLPCFVGLRIKPRTRYMLGQHSMPNHISSPLYHSFA